MTGRILYYKYNKNDNDYSSPLLPLPDQTFLKARFMRATRKYTSSPFNAAIVQGITSPNVNDKEIVQKCLSVVTVLLIPMIFIPKKLATKPIGRKSTVTIVKTKMALLLSSWNVSTSWTFWMAMSFALSRSSSQFLVCSWMRSRILSMALHSKLCLSLRVMLGVLKVAGSRDFRRPARTLICWLSTVLMMEISSWNMFILLRRRRLASYSTFSA